MSIILAERRRIVYGAIASISNCTGGLSVTREIALGGRGICGAETRDEVEAWTQTRLTAVAHRPSSERRHSAR